MPRKTLRDLLDELAPEVEAAFLRSIAQIKSDAQATLIADAISARDVEAVLRLLNLDTAYFAPLDDALRSAFLAGGALAFDEVKALAQPAKGLRVTGRFDALNPRAERQLREWSSGKIVEITNDTRETVREWLGEAMQTDASPRTVARRLIGKSPARGMPRQGGIVGLTSQQAQWADTALEELLSGDPAQMENYLKREARDRRFDRSVKKALRTGGRVPAEVARRAAERYSDRLLQYRGQMIARTEVLGSIHAAHDEGLRQIVASGELPSSAIETEWDSADDAATRSSHRAMDGQRRQAGEPFVTGNGYRMMYPGDRSLGAPASEIIACRCHRRVRLDFVSTLGPGD